MYSERERSFWSFISMPGAIMALLIRDSRSHLQISSDADGTKDYVKGAKRPDYSKKFCHE